MRGKRGQTRGGRVERKEERTVSVCACEREKEQCGSGGCKGSSLILLMRETDMCRATITPGSLIVVTTYQSGYQSDAYERGGVSMKRRLAVFQLPYTGGRVCKHQHQCMQWFPSTILPLEMQRGVTG